MPAISDQDAFDCASLVYSKWAEAWDNLKAVKVEKPDYKLEPDWDLMHQVRLENATKAEARWKEFLQRMTAICPKL